MKNHSKLKIAAACALVFCSSALPAQQASKSKKTVEARLKAEEKPKPAEPLDDAMKAIFTAHRFEQAAISRDGKMVAWVETLLGKDGAPDGNIDLELVQSGQRRIVQCKRWTSWMVPVDEIRQFVSKRVVTALFPGVK